MHVNSYIIREGNKLSQSVNSTNTNYGRKGKKIEPSGGDKRNVENNGRRKSSLGNCESFMNQTYNEKLFDDDDITEEESDPDVVIIAEEDHEEESDLDVIIIAELDPMFDAIDEVVSSTSSMCRKYDTYKELADTTSYYELEFKSSTDALQKNRKKILEEFEFPKFIIDLTNILMIIINSIHLKRRDTFVSKKHFL
ncbi:hypothetical protein H5410_003710 [Solanum commersonii]|uniref:Uncharacterized protein n=1 Tax=Solanum commersonii TaxID=4109 RepID=A0A9J6B5N9_SOLCO|nr:hypothetical protein H5410_003710 [Solanum commersonii]